MSSIGKFVDERLHIVTAPPEPVRFSVNIDYTLNFRLQYLAKKLDFNRAGLAAQFIELAVYEAEKALGLQPFDFNSEYGKEVLACCGGHFYQDETGYYRINSAGEKVKLVSANDESEVDYSLAKETKSNE